ncbi:MAG: hypothetical protein JXR16_11060 [Bermanella sp.]
MFGYSYPVFLLALVFSLTASAQINAIDCHQLFSPILNQEPLLKTELIELEEMCKQDLKDSNEGFWVCIDDRMKAGPSNFERLILSSHVCSTSIE